MSCALELLPRDYSGPPPTEPAPSPRGRAPGIRPPYGGANFQLGGLSSYLPRPAPEAGTGLLSAAELAVHSGLKTEKRRGDWLAGRCAAKRLVRRRLEAAGMLVQPRDIHILSRDSGEPRLRLFGGEPFRLSISHSARWAACALTEPGLLVGVDVEAVEPRPGSWLEQLAHPSELEQDPGLAAEPLVQTAFWTAKEAVLKLLGIGASADFWEVRPSSPEAGAGRGPCDCSGPPPTEPPPSPRGRAAGIRPPYGGANFQSGGLSGYGPFSFRTVPALPPETWAGWKELKLRGRARAAWESLGAPPIELKTRVLNDGLDVLTVARTTAAARFPLGRFLPSQKPGEEAAHAR